MSSGTVILVSVLYLAALFGVAYWGEYRSRKGKSPVTNPYIYALSMAVYCTAWTFYGSVGRVVTNGIEFLSVYIGPTLLAPVWWIVLRKIIRICKVQRITSISDFISSRYGKDIGLGVLVTVVTIIGIIPYIALQLKAITTSFATLSQAHPDNTFLGDLSLYIAVGLALFTVLFGTRKLEATERHEGMVTAVAFESVVKLVTFLAAGLFVTYVVFDGFGDITQRVSQIPRLNSLFTLPAEGGHATLFWHTLLSFGAFLFLPRQFQVSVVENVNESHLRKAMWLFPLYLFIINIFVIPIAFGGKLLLPASIDADNYVLAIPLYFNQKILALLVYIGGFSAATSMIIVETIALSIMLTNSLVMPVLARNPRWQRHINMGRFVAQSRRLGIIIIILLSYVYYRYFGNIASLVSLGLISFAAVSQFAPAIIGGLFWKGATRLGAIVGILAGFSVWFYTLVFPTLLNVIGLSDAILQQGPWGIGWLNPLALFGLSGFDNLSMSVFCSLLLNVCAFVGVSLYTTPTALEHNQAILFVDIFKYSTIQESAAVWRGTAYITDLNSLLAQFMGKARAERVLSLYALRHGINTKNQQADPRLVNYAEKLLAGIVGAASARLMVASVSKEERIGIEEMVDILKSSQEIMGINKELTRKSLQLEEATRQLQEANAQLQQTDKLKDDFLSTVTHELRTPLTSIRALSEILHDNPDLDRDEQEHFLNTIIRESERLSRLINQVLDLEKYESGKQILNKEEITLHELVQEVLDSLKHLADEKKIRIQITTDPFVPPLYADRDKLLQVLYNLVSNAIKYCPPQKGEISITTFFIEQNVVVSVTDNGLGIAPAFQQLIFNRFYQAEAQNIRKPKGSGLGLAISKKIITLHEGKIWVESKPNKGAKFTFTLPALRE